jgi:hypothetical protein
VPTTEQAADILTKPFLKVGLQNAIIQRGNNAKKSVGFARDTKAMLAYSMLDDMTRAIPSALAVRFEWLGP